MNKTEQETVKKFIEMMEFTEVNSFGDTIYTKIHPGGIRKSPEYQTLKALAYKEIEVDDGIPEHIDKAYCLEAVLEIVVNQIFNAKSLDSLKETTAKNFPKEHKVFWEECRIIEEPKKEEHIVEPNKKIYKQTLYEYVEELEKRGTLTVPLMDSRSILGLISEYLEGLED